MSRRTFVNHLFVLCSLLSFSSYTFCSRLIGSQMPRNRGPRYGIRSSGGKRNTHPRCYRAEEPPRSTRPGDEDPDDYLLKRIEESLKNLPPQPEEPKYIFQPDDPSDRPPTEQTYQVQQEPQKPHKPQEPTCSRIADGHYVLCTATKEFLESIDVNPQQVMLIDAEKNTETHHVVLVALDSIAQLYKSTSSVYIKNVTLALGQFTVVAAKLVEKNSIIKQHVADFAQKCAQCMVDGACWVLDHPGQLVKETVEATCKSLQSWIDCAVSLCKLVGTIIEATTDVLCHPVIYTDEVLEKIDKLGQFIGQGTQLLVDKITTPEGRQEICSLVTTVAADALECLERISVEDVRIFALRLGCDAVTGKALFSGIGVIGGLIKNVAWTEKVLSVLKTTSTTSQTITSALRKASVSESQQKQVLYTKISYILRQRIVKAHEAIAATHVAGKVKKITAEGRSCKRYLKDVSKILGNFCLPEGETIPKYFKALKKAGLTEQQINKVAEHALKIVLKERKYTGKELPVFGDLLKHIHKRDLKRIKNQAIRIKKKFVEPVFGKIYAKARDGVKIPKKKLPGEYYQLTNGKFVRYMGPKNTLIPKSMKDELDATQWALQEYKKIRNCTDDIQAVAKNTGLPKIIVEKIKRHVFYDNHHLDLKYGRFDAYNEQAAAWNRLIHGDFIKNDIQWLKHEYAESLLIRETNRVTRIAHEILDQIELEWIIPLYKGE